MFSWEPTKKKSKSKKGKSKSPVKIPVKKGLLTSCGYKLKSPAKERHKSLEKACALYGPTSCFKKLNVLVIFNKNKHPELAAKYKKDRDWVKKNMMVKKE